MSPSRGRRAVSIVLLAVIAAASIGAATSKTAPALRKAAYASAFPSGAGRDIAERECRMCHSPMLVVQQHKDSTGWEKTVTQMQKWGVTLTPAERDSLMHYLRGHFRAGGGATRH